MLTIVLLPGMDGSGLLFQDFVAALDKRINVNVVSYPTNGWLGYEQLTRFVQQQLPTNSPFMILGESFSGPIAIALAAAQPSGLVGLILCCTFAKNPRPTFRHLKKTMGYLPVKLALFAVLTYYLMGRFATPALCSVFRQAYAPVSNTALQARLTAVLSCDVTEKLPAIAVPVLYLRAIHDQVVFFNASEHIAKALPTVQVVPIPGPHFLLQVAPEASARTVEDFVQQVHHPERVDTKHAAAIPSTKHQGNNHTS